MITLKDRARALENKFAYEQDVVFPRPPAATNW